MKHGEARSTAVYSLLWYMSLWHTQSLRHMAVRRTYEPVAVPAAGETTHGHGGRHETGLELLGDG